MNLVFENIVEELKNLSKYRSENFVGLK